MSRYKYVVAVFTKQPYTNVSCSNAKADFTFLLQDSVSAEQKARELAKLYPNFVVRMAKFSQEFEYSDVTVTCLD